jgi:hypothetical protein
MKIKVPRVSTITFYSALYNSIDEPVTDAGKTVSDCIKGSSSTIVQIVK